MAKPRMCAWRRRNRKPCARTSAWVQGEGFDGSPVTYWSRFCEYHELLAKQQGIPTDLVAEGDDGSAPYEFNLVRPDPLACAEWIIQQHGFWCERIGQWVQRVLGTDSPPVAPTIEGIYVLARREAGWYRPGAHECSYVLPYAMSQSDYEGTIAHEVAHAYQRALLPDACQHNEAWRIIMHHCVGDVSTNDCLTFHEYSVQEAIALGKSLVPKVSTFLLPEIRTN